MILHVVGARPNFIKLAPVWHALARLGIEQRIVHTGQHYDALMSDVFFQQLALPAPDFNLEVGSGSHGKQTAAVLERIEGVFMATRPRWIVVYGDVNSTLAATLAGAKLGLNVAHVEAGLRSFDRAMPEELNRIATDQLASLLLTPSVDGDRNLAREGIPSERIRFVGNVMIDSLVMALPHLPAPTVPPGYVLATLHRPANVDQPQRLEEILHSLVAIAKHVPVVFPMHPRTHARLQQVPGAAAALDRLCVLPPQGYLEFLALQKDAKLVITDSGGVQEETTFLQVPCLTMRENTERPVTVEMGTNRLIGQDCRRLIEEVEAVLSGKRLVTGMVPPLWDGHAGDRVAGILQQS
jgi:UDP-N-acetylglucosamine 2-epimerase (non-hydrolysing)